MRISGRSKVLFILSTLLSACAPLLRHGTPATIELTGWIGAHQLTLRGQMIATTAVFQLTASQTEFIAITEVYPESTTPVPYHYLVSGPAIAAYERFYFTRGFEPVTYFLRVTRQALGPVTLTNLGGTQNPPCILGMRAVTADKLAKIQRQDRFTLMGVVIESKIGMNAEKQIAQLAQRLPVSPRRGINRAFSCDVAYAARNSQGVRSLLESAHQRAQHYALPVLLFMNSWWAGTPRNVPDGLGGKFDDLAYQQICYTPDSIQPENTKLRTLLGDRYNPHYCLTTPNQWSNTPWLTMNSPPLNSYRAQRLRETIKLLNEISQGDTSWIAGIALENEPRYWDTSATQGTKYHGAERWADFNPCVIAAAARDGVTLDPADGLLLQELTWLYRNVARYFQDTVNSAYSALATQGLLGRFPLYTHSLQLASLFPGVKINQAAADWACAVGASTGIESIWCQPSDFDRVRE